ncbi:DoxX family membrane protein [Qaidamihabitans albus]|uniref:DoxX family membrane protein n=1 Tax=Qaidamihabitans albus TaxID=2795733 RepID=UPI0027DD304C|nr:DoxX family membrane protein [Qaidamihabitans albus]
MARPLLSAIFISGGITALRDAEGHAQVAKPLVDKAVAPNADALPDAVPTDPVNLVRIDGAVKIAAGSMLALGKFPRLSSILLLGSLTSTTAAAHRFWEHQGEERQQHMVHFIKNAGLAGGLLLAAADTEGKPSVGWRAKRTARDVGKQVQGTTGAVQKRAAKATGKANKTLESALPR